MVLFVEIHRRVLMSYLRLCLLKCMLMWILLWVCLYNNVVSLTLVREYRFIRLIHYYHYLSWLKYCSPWHNRNGWLSVNTKLLACWTRPLRCWCMNCKILCHLSRSPTSFLIYSLQWCMKAASLTLSPALRTLYDVTDSLSRLLMWRMVSCLTFQRLVYLHTERVS